MAGYFVPTDEQYIETVARAIARNRLHQDASDSMQNALGISFDMSEKLEETFDGIFERLWAGNSENDLKQKANYRADAVAAINAINLKLIITSE